MPRSHVQARCRVRRSKRRWRQRKRVHPPAHVRHPARQPHSNSAGNRNHRRPTTASTRASAGVFTVASTTRTSPPSTISTRPVGASLTTSDVSTTTGTNPAPESAVLGYRCRHLNHSTAPLLDRESMLGNRTLVGWSEISDPPNTGRVTVFVVRRRIRTANSTKWLTTEWLICRVQQNC